MTDTTLHQGAPRRASRSRPDDIAIVGLSCLFPKARDLQSFWENILDKVDALNEIPAHRFDWRDYYDPDETARDKIYTKVGGFIDDVPFDPVEYGIPPNALASVEPAHLLTLAAVRAALRDAGYEDRPFPRETTSVILGTGSGIGELGQRYVLRSSLPMVLGEADPRLLAQLPSWTEDSFPGFLLNVLAGRVANRFDLGGVNYTVDAACASSLTAIYDAVKELQTGTSDMVIAGSVDVGQSPFTFMSFCKTRALSKSGRCRVFDAAADGTVISEGLAIAVLKRLSDAERDGDRIHAVIKGVGGSSDGHGRTMTAPDRDGQMRALRRAYAAAGLSPASLGLVEAHGTGTTLGDATEAATVHDLLVESGAAPQSCALGSVKSMVGHTRGAAGMAGLIKAALAVEHKVLPPTVGVEHPVDAVDFENGPVYLNTEMRPWLHSAAHPRRAGVSAFGFGGTNFHAVLEEYRGPSAAGAPPLRRRRWPAELLVWSGTRGEVRDALHRLERALAAGEIASLAALAHALHRDQRAAVPNARPFRLAIVATSLDELGVQLAVARAAIEANASDVADPRGVFATDQPLAAAGGKVAFLFPGQGSQYPDMLRELAAAFAEVRAAFELADETLAERWPRPLSAAIFPPPAFRAAAVQRHAAQLARTDVAQPALGAAALGMRQLLSALEVHPDMAAGHSYGEYAALCVAGVFDAPALLRLSEARGRLIIEAHTGGDLGTMAAVTAAAPRVAELIAGIDGVVVANLNAPEQTVISGSTPAVAAAVERLRAADLSAQAFAVAAGFHSPSVAPARARFAAYLDGVAFAPPRLPVFANTTAAPYPAAPAAIKACLARHLVEPVRFVEQIVAMHERGARLFVEVGPGSVLTDLTRKILAGRPHLAIHTDGAHGGVRALLRAVAQLFVHGVPLSLERLFEGRDVPAPRAESASSPTAFLIHGGGLRRAGAPAPERRKIPSTPTRIPVADPLPPITAAPAPAPTAPLPVPSEQRIPDPQPAAPAAIAHHTAMDEVVQGFQRLMHRFLEAQSNVMLAYLRATDLASAPSNGHAPMPAPQPPPVPVAAPVAAPAPAFAHTPPLPAAREFAPTTTIAAPPPAFAPAAAPAPAPVTLGPAVPPPPAVAPDLRARLLAIASERTGYPTDMLALDLDIEADLGIDSIKRAEILRVFVDEACNGHGHADRAGLVDELARQKTLGAILDKVGARTAAAAPVLAPAAASPRPTAEALRARLLAITSERTGYPAEMLALDLDIEADLGIDSIKRAEILRVFVDDAFGKSAEHAPMVDELARMKTLGAVLDKALAAAPARRPLEEARA